MTNSVFLPQQDEKDTDYIRRVRMMVEPDHQKNILQHYAWRTAVVIANAIQANFYSLSDRHVQTGSPIVEGCNRLMESLERIDQQIGTPPSEDKKFDVYAELRVSTTKMWKEIKLAMGFQADASTHNETLEHVLVATGSDIDQQAFVWELGLLRKEVKNPAGRRTIQELRSTNSQRSIG